MTVGPFGLLQPIADGIKLFSKETIIPAQANRIVFLLAPIMLFTLSLIGWAVIPINIGWALSEINVGILYLFAVSSMGVYGVIMAGVYGTIICEIGALSGKVKGGRDAV